MAEPRDDKVAAAYRAMPASEPPPAIDDAIRAAARRAVKAGPAPARQRWALPVSVAAVLALSIGIALHVEREKPVVIDGTPVPSGSAEYPVSQEPVEPATKLPATQAAPAVRPDAPRKAPLAGDATRQAVTVAPDVLTSKESASGNSALAPQPSAKIAAPMPEPREAKRQNAVAPPGAAVPPAAFTSPPPAPASMPQPPAAVAPPSPAAAAPVPALAAPALRATERARDEAAPMRAPRESGAAGVAKEMAAVTPEKQLERIAELRAAGRHGEADEALAKFRRDHPDYRIPPDLWEKVRPR